MIINDEIKKLYGETAIDDYISSGFYKKFSSFDKFPHEMNKPKVKELCPPKFFEIKNEWHVIIPLEKFSSLNNWGTIPSHKVSEYYVNIRKSIINYNQGYDYKRDRYGKEVFPTKFKMEDNIYVAIITPCIFHTLGGIKISENAEVLNDEKKPISGLFASGEVFGGIHGVMSMKGNILTQSIVF